MGVEQKLVEYICQTVFDDLPKKAVDTVKKIVLTVVGTMIAGKTAEGCRELAEFHQALGGKEQATVFVNGCKIPAHNAAFVNSVTARALDFDDAMAPGMHFGASIVPTALATAEMIGGCDGKHFLTALTLGSEIAARLNLTEAAYDGFDPTGVCSVFAAAGTAGKILRLTESETLNTLALAFNTCGGSFQSNIDGSLAVRVIQGWASQNGLTCAQFAQTGVTGPKHFLTGIYGYYHLFARDMIRPESATEKIGEEYKLQKILFKKYPSCGLTLGSTDAILSIVKETDLVPGNIDRIEVNIPPYAYKLVGHNFETGDNPRVNAQFSIQYCVANALLRGSSKLHHFEEAFVKDTEIMALVEKISVISNQALDATGHTALDMQVLTTSGERLIKKVDIAPGFPGNPLTQKDHENHFRDCIDFANPPFPKEKAHKIINLVSRLEELKDARDLIPMVTV